MKIFTFQVAHVKAENESIIDNINEEKALDDNNANNEIDGGAADFNEKLPV